MKLRVNLLSLVLDNTTADGDKFRRFKKPAWRTLAGEEHKDDVNNATSSFKRSSMAFRMCEGSYDQNQHCVEQEDCRNCIKILAILCRVMSDQVILTLI